uniref:helix-turn-helix transcriptional regulator n=1 Tax=Halosimplex salinum TaxID=1710538 RepID=UPI000F4976EC|nr:helix-turn-helix domain-containing protein [Halosimplex salinum]
MLQWSVVDAVGGALSTGVGSVRVVHPHYPFDFSTVGEPLVGLLQSSASGDLGAMFMAGFILLVLGLGGVAAWHSGIPSLLSRSRSSDSGSSASATDQPETADRPQEPGVEGDSGTETAEPAQRTDQEIIVDILESNDGRMKQAKIVDRTGWSKSKVSMLLSEMEDDGDISKLRVGRENIISLSGNEPEAAGSPFDDE